MSRGKKQFSEFLLGAPARFWAGVKDLPGGIGAFEAGLRQLDQPEFRHEPLAFWLLLAFNRYLSKARWGAMVVEMILGQNPTSIGKYGYHGMDIDRPLEGEVPGLPGWKFELHGRGCCLNHVSGEVIDFNFDHEGKISFIDPMFFQSYLSFLSGAGMPERRLRAPRVLETFWMVEIPLLERSRLLAWSHEITLKKKATAFYREAVHIPGWFEKDRPDFHLAWGLCLLGDFAGAEEILKGKSQLLADIVTREREGRAQRLQTESGRAYGAGFASYFLQARCFNDPETSLPLVEKIIQKHAHDSLLLNSLSILAWQGNPTHLPLLFDLLGRTRRQDEVYALIRKQTLKLILRLTGPDKLSDREREILIRAIRRHGQGFDPEMSILFYLLDQKSGLTELERGLQSGSQPIWINAAAAILMLNRPEAARLIQQDREHPAFRVAEYAIHFLIEHKDIPREIGAADSIPQQASQLVFAMSSLKKELAELPEKWLHHN